MIEYFKAVEFRPLAPFVLAFIPYSVGVVFLLIRIAEIRADRSAARALAARRRSLEHGAGRGWDCPKPGPIHYIPEGVTKGGRRGF